VLNFGWLELIIYNLLIVVLTYFLLRFNFTQKISSKEIQHQSKLTTFRNYLSYVFYDKSIDLKEFFFSSNFNIKTFWHLISISFPISLILISLLASVNNMINYYYKITLFTALKPNTISQIIISFVSILLISFIYLKSRFNKLKNKNV